MSPPAKKKRKTAAGSVPVGARRTTRSQRPGLSLEMIAKVSAFAQYGSDLMNICLAVGPEGTDPIRHTCLRNNMGYLEHCLEMYADHNLSDGRMKSNIACWMEVNKDWRRLCTAERAADDKLSTPAYEDEEGRQIYRADPLTIFNNPAVAIGFGMLDVLRHLVEEVGIDVNACRWSEYRGDREKRHLLYISYMRISSKRCVSKSIFEYVLSRKDIDVCAPPVVRGGEEDKVWHNSFYYPDPSLLESFEAIVQHQSFDPNRIYFRDRRAILPLQEAIVCILTDMEEDSSAATISMKKAKILLEVGADPERATDDFRSPLNIAKLYILREGEHSLNGQLCKALISMMEKYGGEQRWKGSRRRLRSWQRMDWPASPSKSN